jgi:hypothetical protein
MVLHWLLVRLVIPLYFTRSFTCVCLCVLAYTHSLCSLASITKKKEIDYVSFFLFFFFSSLNWLCLRRKASTLSLLTIWLWTNWLIIRFRLIGELETCYCPAWLASCCKENYNYHLGHQVKIESRHGGTELSVFISIGPCDRRDSHGWNVCLLWIYVYK